MKSAAAMGSLLQAVAIMALGKLLFAIQDVIIKEMSGSYPIHEIMTIRGLVAIGLLLVLIHFSIGLIAYLCHCYSSKSPMMAPLKPKTFLSPAKATSCTSRLWPGSNRTAVPAAISRRKPCALSRSNDSAGLVSAKW